MTLKEHTLDLVDRIEEMGERLSAIDERKSEIKKEAAEIKEKKGEDASFPKKLEDEWSDLDNEEVELSGEKEKIIETVVGWCTDVDPTEVNEEKVHDAFEDVDFCEFVVKELTFGQLQGVSDDMMEASFDVDIERQDMHGTPKQGFYQIELLRESIIEQPSGAPTKGEANPAPAEYPIPIGEWLFERVDALNTTGNTQMGNSSLEEAMRSGR